MASYRAPWYKVEEHERILRHHYERLHRVKPTIKTTGRRQGAPRRALGGLTKRQREKREAAMWRRHQKMLRYVLVCVCVCVHVDMLTCFFCLSSASRFVFFLAPYPFFFFFFWGGKRGGFGCFFSLVWGPWL